MGLALRHPPGKTCRKYLLYASWNNVPYFLHQFFTLILCEHQCFVLGSKSPGNCPVWPVWIFIHIASTSIFWMPQIVGKVQFINNTRSFQEWSEIHQKQSRLAARKPAESHDNIIRLWKYRFHTFLPENTGFNRVRLIHFYMTNTMPSFSQSMSALRCFGLVNKISEKLEGK